MTKCIISPKRPVDVDYLKIIVQIRNDEQLTRDDKRLKEKKIDENKARIAFVTRGNFFLGYFAWLVKVLPRSGRANVRIIDDFCPPTS